jgi:transcriptional regulator with XRE-family HTH domain
VKDLASRLLEVLIKKGDGRGAFAQKAGISPAVLSHIASGRNAPSLELVLSILKIYPDVSPDWLLMGKGDWIRQIGLAAGEETKEKSAQDLFSSQEKTEHQEKTMLQVETNTLDKEKAQLMRKIEELRFLLKLHARNAEESLSDLEKEIKSLED